MNKLSREARARILGMMVEGGSIRAISRMTGVSKNTIVKLLADAGEAFSEYQDQVMHDLACKRLQVDEIWAFTYAKTKNVPSAKAVPEGVGGCWTWMAIDADTKLIPSFYVGAHGAEAAQLFVDDLAVRLTNRVQLTSDGHKLYLKAVEQSCGTNIDYATLVKVYGGDPAGAGRHNLGICKNAIKTCVESKPDAKHVSTSYTKSAGLTLRMRSCRFVRFANTPSKKIESHAHSVAIHLMHYNFVRIHQALRCTPAMAACVSATLWELADMVKVLESWEEANLN